MTNRAPGTIFEERVEMKTAVFLFACLIAVQTSFPIAAMGADDEEGPIVDHSVIKPILLSLVLPGAGQVYNKQFRKAIAVFVCTAAAGAAMAQTLTNNQDEIGFQVFSTIATVGLYTYAVIDAGRTASKIRNAELIVTGITPFVTPKEAGLMVTMKW